MEIAIKEMILRGCIYTHPTYLKKIRMEEKSYFNHKIQPISIREKITVILRRQGYNDRLYSIHTLLELYPLQPKITTALKMAFHY